LPTPEKGVLDFKTTVEQDIEIQRALFEESWKGRSPADLAQTSASQTI
jgi:hypothetical protein